MGYASGLDQLQREAEERKLEREHEAKMAYLRYDRWKLFKPTIEAMFFGGLFVLTALIISGTIIACFYITHTF